MTEQAWLGATDPSAMIAYLASVERPSPRKLRLFAGACVRQVWDLFPRAICREAVTLAERYADGLVGGHELVATYLHIGALLDEFAFSLNDAPHQGDRMAAFRACAALPHLTASGGAFTRNADGEPAVFDPAQEARWAAVSCGRALVLAGRVGVEALHEGFVEQARLLRDVFGALPFRGRTWPAPQPAGPIARELALAAYDERLLPSGELDPARLGVLADALEEAGCAEAGLLAHLRGPGPHVRGCWAVDAVLGRA